MTNHERARNQFQMAMDIFEESRLALGARRWNLALRRAQEVVELCLKSIIVLSGSDYPRVHDAAAGFAHIVRERGIDVDPETMSEITFLSSDLASKRAPALYREIDVSEADARRAVGGAEKVLAVAIRLWDELTQLDNDAEDTIKD